MQKRLVKHLLLGFAAFLVLALPLAASNLHLGPNDNETGSCPAPQPSGLTVTGTSATTISIAWFSGAGLYYKIEVYDMTASQSLPDMYTIGSSALIDSLPTAHDFEIKVSASYCSDGPYGTAAVVYASTGNIIVEGIVYIQSPCTPQGGSTVTPYTPYPNCVDESNYVNSPFDNAAIGKLTYQGAVLYFAMAWEQDTLHIGKVGNQGYASDANYVFYPINDQSAVCRYDGTPIFTATLIQNALDVAQVDLYFFQQCTFTRCGVVSCEPEQLPHDNNNGLPKKKSEGEGAEEREQDQNIVTLPTPNPFSEHARLQYQLSEPTTVEIKLYDVLGKLAQTVQSATLLSKGTHEAIVDGATLPDGVYILTVQTGTEHKTFTLVKRE